MHARLDNFKASARRHGILWTILRYTDSFLRRYFTYEVCQVETNAEDYRDREDVEGFKIRSVSDREFRDCLCEELEEADYQWAFDRGDFCIASLRDDRIVGFTFYTRQPTVVRPGLVFSFPETCIYAYGSSTAPSQRGNKLESARWKAAQTEVIRRTGHDLPRIFYFNVMNLESRAANRRSGTNKRIGYTGYLRAGRWLCFRSFGCHRAGAGIQPEQQTRNSSAP
jgi:hypothetical protein